jgi:TonB-linked SusC/RagA family outer membrane protein
MKNLIIALGLLLLLFGYSPLFAQGGFKLEGKVISPFDKQPVKDALVSVPGIAGTVKTDESGIFSIEIPKAGSTVEIWAPGYFNMVKPVSDEKMTFVLVPRNKLNFSNTMLNPFGELYAREKATAMSNIDKDDFQKSSLFVDEALHNAFPGLRVVKGSGMPGEGSYMNARGISSMMGNSTPLIVVNGVPYLPDMNESPIIGGFSNNIFNGMSTADIKNITYVKGADAAMYGSMGSNGVLMIETDDATDLQTRVSFYGQYGVSTLAKAMPTMGVSDYKTYLGNVALTYFDDMANILTEFPFLVDDPEYYYKFLYNNNSDWQQMITRPAFVTENILKIKGGDAIAKYDLSFGYLNQAGIIENSGLSRYHMRLNSNINVSQKIDLFASMSLAYLTNGLHEQGMIMETNPILAAMAKSPLVSAYQKDEYNNNLPDYAAIRDASGNIILNNAVSNPLALVNTTKIKNEGSDVLMSGGINYNMTDRLRFTAMIGLYNNYNRSELFVPGVSNGTIMPLLDGLAKNTVRQGIQEAFNVYYHVNATYSRQFSTVHRLKAIAGWQALTTKKEFDAGEGRNTSSDFYKTLDNVNTIGRRFFGYIQKWNWMNGYVHASYQYNNIVTTGINVSFDKASSLGSQAPQLGVFPAANAAVHFENMKPFNNLYFLNKLTLRGEYIMTGNSNYASNLSDYYYRNQVFGQLSGIVRAGIPNTRLKWEDNRTMNLGIDFSGFGHKVDLTFDVYSRQATDVIYPKSIPSPFGTEFIYDNLATIDNKGFEAGIQAYLFNTRKAFFLLGGTIARNKNIVADLGGQSESIIEFQDGSAVITRVGEAVYSFYGYKTDGVFASTSDAQNSGLVNFAGIPFGAGDVKFININDTDNKIDYQDRVVLGNPNPDFFGKVYASLGIGRFSLTANFAYSYGNEVYNALRREFESMKGFGNQLTSANRRWQSEGQITDMPRAVYGDPMDNSRFSDRWIEDGSYIKLRELTLSYTIKRGDLKFLEGGTVYISGENLYTFTKYLGFDPEFAYSYEPYKQGIDFGKVPMPRSIKFGFKLQF